MSALRRIVRPGVSAVAGLEADEAFHNDADAADAVLESQSISREEDTSGDLWLPLGTLKLA